MACQETYAVVYKNSTVQQSRDLYYWVSVAMFPLHVSIEILWYEFIGWSYKSITTSSCGRAQQISKFPTAGASKGRWHTPLRHDHGTATSHASARSIADPIAIANTHFMVGQTIDGRILSELAIFQFGAVKLPLPMAVGLQLVHQ
jgi:hypothetical protein